MANLETLEKSLNKLENYTVKYIYKKYIEIDSTPEPTTTESTLNIYWKRSIIATKYFIQINIDANH